MKKVSLLAVVFGLMFSTTAFAQNIENVKKETTVKKVTVKDTDVSTVVEKDIKEEVTAVKVEGSDKTNQTSENVIVRDTKTQTVDVVSEGVNKENQAKLEAKKKEEASRIDGQQRGVPIQTKDDSQTKPLINENKLRGDDK